MRTASSEGPRRSSFRRMTWRATHLFAWLAVMLLLVVAALRIVYHDGAYALIWLNAFTRYVYLPAYVCLAWALWQRRWMLAGTAAGVVAAHLTFIAPDFLP